MDEHERHIVTVRGDKPAYSDNPAYYDAISEMAIKLSNERAEHIVFYPMLKQHDDRLVEIVSSTRGFADELVRRLEQTKRYRKVEARSEMIHNLFGHREN